MIDTSAPARERLPHRTLIVHDWLQGLHGSERVVLAMQDLFEGGADIATFMADRDNLPDALSDRIVTTARASQLPGLRQRHGGGGRWRYLLPTMPGWFRRLDTSGYDLVLSSSHACAIGVRSSGTTPHVSYVHTPIRYVWMEDLDRRFTGVQSLAMGMMRSSLRRQDLRASTSPDVLVANSTAVQERIRGIWNRSSTVVHPPVWLESNGARAEATDERERGHLLWVHRFVDYKRPLEVARAFAELPDYRLTMVGVGPLASRVQALAPPNVAVRGWVERPELERLFRQASGFLHVGEEDFGISMVEALAAGVPVIGLDRGGATDIVRPGLDGLLIPDAQPRTIASAVRSLDDRDWDPDLLRARAERFSLTRFHAALSAVITNATAR